MGKVLMKTNKTKNGAQTVSANTMNTISQKFWENIVQLCMQVKNGESTWQDVSDFAAQNGIEMSKDYIRQGCRILFAAVDGGMTLSASDAAEKLTSGLTEAAQKIPQCSETKADGTVARDYLVEADRLAKLFENGDLSEKKVREWFGIPDTLVITSLKYQVWHGAIKGGGKQMLYNIKVNLAPKGAKDITPEDFEQFFEDNEERFAALPAVPKFEPAPDASTWLECDFADPHFGLLAHNKEVGENYDLKIARDRTLMCARSIVNRNKGRQFKGINLVTLGDIIHVDNGDMTTAHGTKQDTEGRVPKMLDVAVATLVEVVRILEELKSPITYTYVPGNHDTNLGYAVAKCVQAMLKDDANVTFDITPSLFKTVTYGCTIVGLSHGESNDKRAHTDLINQHRREFGKSDYAEVHMGHLHSEAARDVIGGVMLYRMPAICTSSYWEKSKGYAAVGRGVMTFEYDPYEGKVGIGYHTINGIAARMAAEKKNSRA